LFSTKSTARIGKTKYRKSLIEADNKRPIRLINRIKYALNGQQILSRLGGREDRASALQSEEYRFPIAGSIPVYGRFATRFSKEFNLTMLTMAMVALATVTVVLRAA